MATSYDYLLLGGGTSCGYAAAAIRENDKTGTIGIVGADTEPPYDRPPFSKYFLTDSTKLVSDFHSKDESFYPENNVELRLGMRATEIDREHKQVAFESGEIIGYGKMLYALGCSARPIHKDTEEEIYYLRSAADSLRIRKMAEPGGSCVIIGGGYVGCELAASLAARGVEVTIVEQGDHVHPNFASRPIAEAIQRELVGMGVHVATNDPVAHIFGGTRITTREGHEFTGDFIVAAVGHIHNRELAKNAHLEMGMHGVRANSKLRTSDANIFVSGDIAEFDDSVLGDVYIAEHHLHAKASAQHAGRVMSGIEEPFRNVPYFFSDVGPLSMILRGYPERGEQSFVFGNAEAPFITELFLSAGGRILGVIDLRKDYKQQDPISEMFEKLILNRVNLASQVEQLRQPGYDLMSLGDLVTA